MFFHAILVCIKYQLRTKKKKKQTAVFYIKCVVLLSNYEE